MFLWAPTLICERSHTQGIKAVIAESYERIHRSNLVGMGIVPLQYQAGETADTLGLTGKETYTIEMSDTPVMGELVNIKVRLLLIFFYNYFIVCNIIIFRSFLLFKI